MADTLEAAIEFVLRAGMPCPVDRTYTALANVLGTVTSPAIDVAIITVNYDICAAVNNLLLASLAARPIRVMIADPLQEVRERIAGQLAAANPRVRIEEQLSAELALESLSL